VAEHERVEDDEHITEVVFSPKVDGVVLQMRDVNLRIVGEAFRG